MTQTLPIVLVPALNASPRLFAEQIPYLWRFGPITIANHRDDDSMDAIAERILADAPHRFALAGLSMGGYISFAIMRKAPERVVKLALLDTAAGADRPEQTQRRQQQIDIAKAGRFSEIADLQWPLLVHKERQGDAHLKNIVRQMAQETGADAFVRQQRAIAARPDSRPSLPGIACKTLMLVGAGDQITPPEAAKEIAGLIPQSRLVVVEGCGHFSALERPQQVTQALVEWMES